MKSSRKHNISELEILSNQPRNNRSILASGQFWVFIISSIILPNALRIVSIFLYISYGGVDLGFIALSNGNSSLGTLIWAQACTSLVFLSPLILYTIYLVFGDLRGYPKRYTASILVLSILLTIFYIAIFTTLFTNGQFALQ